MDGWGGGVGGVRGVKGVEEKGASDAYARAGASLSETCESIGCKDFLATTGHRRLSLLGFARTAGVFFFTCVVHTSNRRRDTIGARLAIKRRSLAAVFHMQSNGSGKDSRALCGVRRPSDRR